MINNIKYLFFDVDDTLFDFDKCSRAAIQSGFKKYGLKYDDNVYRTFQSINREFWRRIEKDEIDRNYLSEHRFNAVFDALGISFDGTVFEKDFRQGLYESHEEIEGAAQVVKLLSKKYPLYVASNAFYNQQVNRLRLAGLYDCFCDVFVSERIGYSKPSPKFFSAVLNNAGIKDSSTALMIGDSLTADIEGAREVGMKTCWITKQCIDKSCADYVIDDIRRLIPLLT